MNKLPHEILREFAESTGCKGCNHFASIAGSGCNEFDTCTDCINAAAATIADEIEKYYDPKLHFVDGELVNEGDKYVDQFGHECTISRIDIRVRIWDENGEYENVDVHKPLKRPEPKILDAKGEEINVGDTVWCVYHTERFVVEDIHETDGVMFVHVHGDGDHRTCFKPHELTHREPDSLEKLRDDMNYSIIEGTYLGTAHEYLCQCAKRLTAIMERDA